GKQIEENKEVVLRAFKEGHLVLNHSWNHSRFSTISKKDIMQEVETTEKILDKYIGKRPLLMRVPYGDINDIGLQQLKDLKYKLIFWSLDTLDWFEKTKDAIVEKVISNVRPGEIILMHSNSDKGATAEALSTIINVLKDRGYSFTTIDNFVNN
ncbi:polysaccharide deacetylase family protein, partial [Candidatus Dependentiae bacterium]|nr:polysaccharide deacetylase family protein [Candidatus Dependentiae bacterium]